jgi:hypothetical protein
MPHETKSPEEIAKWDRSFGVEFNNKAWTLSEQPTVSEEERDEMLHLAHAAALHWGRIGTELHRARAAMLLGQVYGVLGHGKLAFQFAKRSFDYVTSHESPDWELALAHAVLANACYALGNRPDFSNHYRRNFLLRSSLNQIRGICKSTKCSRYILMAMREGSIYGAGSCILAYGTATPLAWAHEVGHALGVSTMNPSPTQSGPYSQYHDPGPWPIEFQTDGLNVPGQVGVMFWQSLFPQNVNWIRQQDWIKANGSTTNYN